MKKLILSLAVLTAMATTSFAQLGGGLKVGLNLATLSGDIEDVDMKAGFHFGGYLELPLSDQLTFQPELLYNQVGAKFSEEDNYTEAGMDVSEKYDVTYKLNYISIPLMLKYSFGPVNVQAGPQLGFLASSKGKLEYEIIVDGDVEASGEEEEDLEDVKGLDLGLNFGLGLDLGKFNAAARYSLGLSNINDEGDEKAKNSVIQISLGYRLFGGE